MNESSTADTVEVVIETPRHSRVKFKQGASGAYQIDRILPQGWRFPFNYGFIPSTRAADGDPTDVLLILEEPLFPGCHALCRILGVLQAEQTEGGHTVRNDRILAACVKDKAAPRDLAHVSRDFLSDVERFFVTYHQAQGNVFKVLALAGVEDALQLIKATAVNGAF